MLALELEPLYAAQAARRREQLGREAAVRQQAERKERVGADLPQPSLKQNDLSVIDTSSPQHPRLVPAPRARDHAAEQAKTSGRAVAQAKRVVQQAPDLATKVKAGTVALDRAERIVRDREAEQRRIEQARREAEAQPERTRVDIRHGDFREELADLQDVDAVITDPPYPAEYLPLLADLAGWADKVLAPDGVLAVLIGQTHLPEVYRLLDGHRPYRWTACYLTEGNGYVSHQRKVTCNWKPLLVYGGGPRFADLIRAAGGNADAKNNHKWGQDYQAFHTLIERLTTRGQTVVDPFAGSGTTLLAAHALGRHAIGCDIDTDSVETARRRLA
jgi:16S rRNA G966 N2-methylase RsmD